MTDEQRRPSTPHGQKILADWLMLRPDYPPNTAKIRDWIIEAEREAAAERDRLEAALRGLLDTLDEYRGDLSMGPTDTWRAARAALGEER